MMAVARWLGWAAVWVVVGIIALLGLFWIIADWDKITSRFDGAAGAVMLSTMLIALWLHGLEQRLDAIAERQREIMDRLPRRHGD